MSIKKLKNIPNKDTFQRINFLAQASELMADKNDVLSCYYGNLLKQIGKKSVLKIDHSIKRSFCKRCSIALTPKTSDLSATDDSKIGLVECQKCGYIKRYPINDYHKLWSEKKEAIQEIVEFGTSQEEHTNEVPQNTNPINSNKNSKQKIKQNSPEKNLEFTL